MINNVGTVDRMIRLIAGLALLFAPLLNVPEIWSSSLLAYASMAVGIVLIATATVRFCPLYRVLGVNTCGT